MPATPDDLFARLDELGIEVETRQHAPLFTVEESQALRGEIPGGHTKNLFLKDKKDRLWLVVAPEDAAVDLKRLPDAIGSARLSFGKAELMEEVLGVVPGSVTPFAIINDTGGRVSVVLSDELLGHEVLNFHPLVNTMTTTIGRDDLVAFLKAENHAPLVATLPTVDAG
ncbi:prolyl-tRNA synthetase associated domain-containing protein [Lutibaculum baratangense]|uniref:Aminoacyl-tRNA editing enzymes YbaK, ProX n=1 Tax=Lutibaculum baratangense AMV1 TaxID=631454 RepID=V4RCQ6_9HYPH|nr:prolyl-tRNA synthetase associated domain-containing protein [Lutibaculum baratangense]ESR23911.1 Aminoacyl-tRNA editing enzymes YbaK, ProX [Lutibaculum baratangense AMV1]